jgi:MGT family glycosyltransferase
MARFLFASVPLIGHINPGFPVVRELVSRGHEVGWYTGKYFQKEVEAAGARFFPRKAARDFNALYIDEVFPEKKNLRGLASLKFDVKHLFLDSIPGHLADLTEIMNEFCAEVVVSDAAFFGMEILHEELDCGWAAYGISCLCSHSADVPPFGSNIQYSSSRLAPVRNRLLNYLAEQVVGRDVMKHYDKIRTALDVEPSPHYLANIIIKKADLFIQPSIPAFEYPRRDLPRTVHFVGAYLPQVATPFIPPAWWEELHLARAVVHVTQGTMSTDYSDLLLPALQALAKENYLVVAATGGKPVELLNMDALPSNVRLAPFIPYQHLLPLVDVMITNGGYGGVQLALAHGVPLVAAGQTEEKPEIGARIQWSGAGINLKAQKPAPAKIRQAVRKILETPGFRKNAQRLKTEYRQYNAACLAADLLEQLASTKRPVMKKFNT